MWVADGVRFELTVRCRTPHFECGAIDHSATHPYSKSERGRQEGRINTRARVCSQLRRGRLHQLMASSAEPIEKLAPKPISKALSPALTLPPLIN